MKLRVKRARHVKRKNPWGSYLGSYWGTAHCSKKDRDLACPNCAAYDFLDKFGRFPYNWEEMHEQYRSNS